MKIAGSGRARGSVGAGGRACASADQCGNPRGKSRLDQLWADEMHVRINAAGGHNLPFARNHLGSRTNHHPRCNAGHHIRVAGFPDANDPSAANADIGLDNSPMIQNDRAGDDQVEGFVGGGRAGGLPHSVSYDLSAAKFCFFAVYGKIAFNFNKKVSVREPYPVAGGWAIKIGVLFAGNS